MGLFQNIGDGLKSCVICIISVIQSIKISIVDKVDPVSEISSSVLNTISNVFETINPSVTLVKNHILEITGIGKLTDEIIQDKIFKETQLIGSIIIIIYKKYQFLQNTTRGQNIIKIKDRFDLTTQGRFINAVWPLIKIILFFHGGVQGIVFNVAIILFNKYGNRSYFLESERNLKREIYVQTDKTVESYIQKFSISDDNNYAKTKFHNIFEVMDPYQSSNSGTKSLIYQITNNTISVNNIFFNLCEEEEEEEEGEEGEEGGYTIQGKLELKNNTESLQRFEIQDGQIFGCKTPDTAQHTVVRGIQGELKSQETKTFNLEAFCADCSLSWPYQSSDYELTFLKLKNFNSNTDQGTAWDMTS